MAPDARREYLFNKGETKGAKIEIKIMKSQLDALLDRPVLGSIFSFSHPVSRASVAAAFNTEEDAIPDELVGINPTKVISGNRAEEEYKARYAAGIYGELPTEGDDFNLDACALLKKQKKDMAKLTKILLKPQETHKEIKKKLQQRKMDIKQKRATKKREKRRRKRNPPQSKKDQD